MPILRVPEQHEPLQQGDVLKGVTLYATGRNWGERGGSQEKLQARLSLVISRSCVIEHKPQIVVAAIEKRVDRVPGNVRSFGDAKAYLQDLRDGGTRPDRFYLGQIPGEVVARYYAKFDSLHTVALPKDQNAAELLSEYRIASLNIEFVRDLHMRLFCAFAELGFDDIKWYADGDLQWLIDKGEHAIQSERTSLAESKARKSELEAAGVDKPKEKDELDRKLANNTKSIANLEDEIGRLKAELQRRNT